jgi:hypothetical protein
VKPFIINVLAALGATLAALGGVSNAQPKHSYKRTILNKAQVTDCDRLSKKCRRTYFLID